MSYDYMLVKSKDDLNDSIEAFAESVMSETIGPVEDIKTQISHIFPSVRWDTSLAVPLPGIDVNTVFGYDGPPEFQLMVEPDGQVRMITMSYAERNEVELVAKKLGLIVLDEQSMEIFDG